ncbi:predicted protein [Histoplasma mississippiense (nom. inval.)]|uniref:predicted protein n=1 Tax=Ajellomyces capsulatus (strain NAm1 / WU24) TaxID=2059318 RepID=UPI000157BF1C|nr:predicted protein [Histoplasma mississippiense (nom. inval.)]EDN06482.1 predicted protein [Histoplasma mississippiense (nom. inval.)]
MPAPLYKMQKTPAKWPDCTGGIGPCNNGANLRSKEEVNAKIQSQLLKQAQLSASGIVPTIEARANQRMMKELVEVVVALSVSHME